MLTFLLGCTSLAFLGLWLLETWRHIKTCRHITGKAQARLARLANALLRTRQAFISDVYKAPDLSGAALHREAMEAANLLAACEFLIERLNTGAATARADITPQMATVQRLVARCGAMVDPFFRDTSLFYLAGLLEHGGRADEAQLLRNALKHGILRAKALNAHSILQEQVLPHVVKNELLAGLAHQPVSPSRAATTLRRAASALDWPPVTGFMRYCSKMRSSTVICEESSRLLDSSEEAFVDISAR